MEKRIRKYMTVMVFGTFDVFHKGHENYFKQARKYGDCLIVVVARDKTVKEVKGKLPKNKERIRLNNIIKLKIADKVILGDFKDKYKKIKKYKPNVICLGYDQNFFVGGLKNLDIKIVRSKPYKPEIYKSSIIKKLKPEKIKHESVGAIIRKNGKILMIDRKKYPFGWACPAGHVNLGESPEEALKREIKEETNLKILKYKLLAHEYVDWNKCSSGVRGHDWYVYETISWRGRVKQNKREEKKIKWVDVTDIKKLKLERIWKYWFSKIKEE